MDNLPFELVTEREYKYILLPDHTIKPCSDVMEWATQFGNSHTVGLTEMGDANVSTVFLGLDHNYSDGPPLVFETLVFGGKLKGAKRRYATWDEAVAGHAAMVAEVKKSTIIGWVKYYTSAIWAQLRRSEPQCNAGNNRQQ